MIGEGNVCQESWGDEAIATGDREAQDEKPDVVDGCQLKRMERGEYGGTSYQGWMVQSGRTTPYLDASLKLHSRTFRFIVVSNYQLAGLLLRSYFGFPVSPSPNPCLHRPIGPVVSSCRCDKYHD